MVREGGRQAGEPPSSRDTHLLLCHGIQVPAVRAEYQVTQDGAALLGHHALIGQRRPAAGVREVHQDLWERDPHCVCVCVCRGSLPAPAPPRGTWQDHCAQLNFIKRRRPQPRCGGPQGQDDHCPTPVPVSSRTATAQAGAAGQRKGYLCRGAEAHGAQIQGNPPAGGRLSEGLL